MWIKLVFRWTSECFPNFVIITNNFTATDIYLSFDFVAFNFRYNAEWVIYVLVDVFVLCWYPSLQLYGTYSFYAGYETLTRQGYTQLSYSISYSPSSHPTSCNYQAAVTYTSNQPFPTLGVRFFWGGKAAPTKEKKNSDRHPN